MMRKLVSPLIFSAVGARNMNVFELIGSHEKLFVPLFAILPFIAAVFAPLIKKAVGHRAAWILALVPAFIFVGLFSYLDQLQNARVITIEWIPALDIKLSFLIDQLSVMFGLLISGIGTFIVIYAGGYLKSSQHQGRFFAFLLMFMGSMLGLVLANGLMTLFIFWELTSITSFLLIGFDYKRRAARRAALQALVVTGGGGLALLVGFILLYQFYGTWELSDIFALEAASDLDLATKAVYLPALLLILAGAFTKSAQYPFHFWLPNAMEAPTPVSAYLHSATMVKAGVYLLMRLSPIFADGYSPIDGNAFPFGDFQTFFWWPILLGTFGGVTLLYGALMSLRQTDMKQMLAYTTVASLGLLVMLIGAINITVIISSVLFLFAHALYKGALFMLVGVIDHSTGTRDITRVCGLLTKMPLTFAVAALAALAMSGAIPFLAFVAKEEMYIGLYEVAGHVSLLFAILLVVAVIGNALMMGVGLAIAIKPFLGIFKSTPKKPHEGGVMLLLGAAVLSIIGLVAGPWVGDLSRILFVPAAQIIFSGAVGDNVGYAVKFPTRLEDYFKLAFALSVMTWIMGGLVFIYLDILRARLKRLGETLSFGPDKLFDVSIKSLVRLGWVISRVTQSGRMENYMLVTFMTLGLAMFVPMIVFDLWPQVPDMPQFKVYEWAMIAIAIIGIASLLLARSRLTAIVAVGIQGFAVALIYMLFGAPDLSFTQFMVETLSVIILALAMTRLQLDARDPRNFESTIRDAAVAIFCGVGFMLVLLMVLEGSIDLRLSEAFGDTSMPLAFGRNIVNVILVDYRAIDTLGEIVVVMTAGIAILALVRIRADGQKPKLLTGLQMPRQAKTDIETDEDATKTKQT